MFSILVHCEIISQPWVGKFESNSRRIVGNKVQLPEYVAEDQIQFTPSEALLKLAARNKVTKDRDALYTQATSRSFGKWNEIFLKFGRILLKPPLRFKRAGIRENLRVSMNNGRAHRHDSLSEAISMSDPTDGLWLGLTPAGIISPDISLSVGPTMRGRGVTIPWAILRDSFITAVYARTSWAPPRRFPKCREELTRYVSFSKVS